MTDRKMGFFRRMAVDYIFVLAKERQSELASVAGEREVWGPLLELLSLWPDFGHRLIMDG